MHRRIIPAPAIPATVIPMTCTFKVYVRWVLFVHTWRCIPQRLLKMNAMSQVYYVGR